MRALARGPLSGSLGAVLVAAAANLGYAAVTEIQVPSETANRPLTAYLVTPSGVGPFPAAILLHGCGGLQYDTRQVLREQAEWYATRGYAALIVDSFGGRRVTETCSQRGMSPNPVARAWDAYRALDKLVSAGIADPRRTVVQGLSHGGAAVLHALDRSVAERSGIPYRFAAGIAYYPDCSGALGLSLYAPLLVLIGELDDWTPAAPCVQFEQHQKGLNSADVRLTVYPGVAHLFDFPGGRRRSQSGKLLGHDPMAARDAERRREAFLRHVVR
jgi:dienelactone hydrolase